MVHALRHSTALLFHTQVRGCRMLIFGKRFSFWSLGGRCWSSPWEALSCRSPPPCRHHLECTRPSQTRRAECDLPAIFIASRVVSGRQAPCVLLNTGVLSTDMCLEKVTPITSHARFFGDEEKVGACKNLPHPASTRHRTHTSHVGPRAIYGSSHSGSVGLRPRPRQALCHHGA